MVRDVHPAEVSLSDGRFMTGARAFLTTERLIVWRSDRNRQVYKALEVPVTFAETVVRTRNTLGAHERLEVFSNDVTVSINKGQGCGCHSPLKALPTPIPWAKG